MKILMIIPAYNEQDNILNTIHDIKENAPDVDYVVINDCSKDDTKKVLSDYGANFLDLPINLGIGGGVQMGYRYALERGYDIAIQFDGDGQHDASYIKDLVIPIEQGLADVVVGSRFIKKEGFQSSALRRLGINFLSGLIKFLCGTKVYDVTSGFRAVNRKMIVHFSDHYPQDYPEPDAILDSSLVGARIMEIPVRMRERANGESSIRAFKSVYYMVKVSISLLVSRITRKRRNVK